MSRLRRDRGGTTHLRQLGAVAAFAAVLFAPLAAQAQFLPEGFFATLPSPGAVAEVEANTLSYDGIADVISAQGRASMKYAGYTLVCDNLRYEQRSGALLCIGNVEMRDPAGNVSRSDRLEVTGGMKEAFIQSLTLTTTDGAMITASDARYAAELETILTDATYSPCGLCIDEKGRRIGWQVKAAKLVQNDETKTIYFEQPTLEILGVPVAWLPWLSLPDPTSRRNTGFLLPSVNYDAAYGARVTAPFFIALGEDADILLSPSLMTRQGFLMAAEYQQRFDYGAFTLKASGLYQLDPGAFDGIGDREWRGAIQTSGEFRPIETWTAGWSYSKFTDAAYLDDYDFNTDEWDVNEVYATHLSRDYYADIRLQEFLKLGRYDSEALATLAQDQQAATLPNARGTGYFDLGEWGQVRATGSLLGVYRNEDDTDSFDGVDYAFGYAGTKTHASAEVSWQRQVIAPGGIVATPYLGLRSDITDYDRGALAGPLEPDDQLLFEATPIAAIDVRWPLIAVNGYDSHLLEPIAQVVYRGSDTSLVGVTNDNAHSFVLDDTNIFSYDRFTGTDRQETGLRANIGARYLANFSAGQWLEIVGGQSFHLAGTNAFGAADPTNAGIGSGLETDASYIVLGARGAPLDGLTLGAKMQIDAADLRVARAGMGGDFDLGNDYSVGGDYVYLAADSDTGVSEDQHELTVRASAPLPIDYWKTNGSLSWDIAANEWLQARGEVYYDDGYFLAGGFAQANGPTHTSANSVAFGVKFALKGPGGDAVTGD